MGLGCPGCGFMQLATSSPETLSWFDRNWPWLAGGTGLVLLAAYRMRKGGQEFCKLPESKQERESRGGWGPSYWRMPRAKRLRKWPMKECGR